MLGSTAGRDLWLERAWRRGVNLKTKEKRDEEQFELLLALYDEWSH